MDAESVEDALDVLRDLVLWEMAPHRWAQVDEILHRIAAATAARDAETLRAAVADLELSGPVRALRIGSSDPVGIPAGLLERQNTLVHALTAERARQRDTTDGPEDSRGRQPAR